MAYAQPRKEFRKPFGNEKRYISQHITVVLRVIDGRQTIRFVSCQNNKHVKVSKCQGVGHLKKEL